MHYPKPNTPTPRGTVIPRTLTPIVNKPRTLGSAELTKLVPVTSRTFLPGWTCSTHVCPAANPRETPAAKIRDTPKSITMTKDERRGLADANFERMTAIRNSLDSKTSTNESPMWTVVNRYAPEKPRSNDPAITLVFSHATGFHKEASAPPYSLVDHLNLTWTKKIWESTVRHLISAIESNPLYSGIDEIWALDAANHGDSALLNKSNLGDIFEWSDHARDILNFMINYLPESIEQHGVSLQPLSASAARQRRDQGFKSRRIIGIGHSFGGCTLARAAIDSPSLFYSIMLVDPVVYPSYAIRGPGIDALTKGALARRDHWPDREAAKAGLLNSPFFKAWDPEVLDDYVRYGMYEHEGQVWLKCSGFQEAATFSENSRLPCEVWELLPSIPERIPLKWVMDSTVGLVSTGSQLIAMGPTGPEDLSSHGIPFGDDRQIRLTLRSAAQVIWQIPQEAPRALAREILDFMQARDGNSTTDTVKSKL